MAIEPVFRSVLARCLALYDAEDEYAEGRWRCTLRVAYADTKESFFRCTGTADTIARARRDAMWRGLAYLVDRLPSFRRVPWIELHLDAPLCLLIAPPAEWLDAPDVLGVAWQGDAPALVQVACRHGVALDRADAAWVHACLGDARHACATFGPSADPRLARAYDVQAAFGRFAPMAGHAWSIDDALRLAIRARRAPIRDDIRGVDWAAAARQAASATRPWRTSRATRGPARAPAVARVLTRGTGRRSDATGSWRSTRCSSAAGTAGSVGSRGKGATGRVVVRSAVRAARARAPARHDVGQYEERRVAHVHRLRQLRPRCHVEERARDDDALRDASIGVAASRRNWSHHPSAWWHRAASSCRTVTCMDPASGDG